ncbi:MAG TPA: hypothetical protein PLI00_05800 [Pseudomonadota bacterium]|nr:hypothetical protein [Pseudomonadota bacterium]
MPTARQLRDFEATIRAHPQWPRALCFGDSWFNYPLAPVDLHKQLRRGFRRTAFLNESKAGRESADIKELLPGLRRLLSSYRFTALLVSMGGNDVVGGELAEYVKPADEPQSPYDPRWGVVPASVRDHIRLSAFEQALRYVVEDFQRVIDARNALAPDCEIVVHNYDHVFPSGKSFKLLGRKAGPWIKPYLNGVGLTDPLRQREACAWLIDQFTRMLDALVTQTPRMRLVDGRGTLRHAGEWDNEIHPKGPGFRKLAQSRWQPVLAGLLR